MALDSPGLDVGLRDVITVKGREPRLTPLCVETFGVAAGAIAQVIWAVGATMPRAHRLSSPIGAAGLIAGVIVMYATGLLVA